jgi:hypothetical protein
MARLPHDAYVWQRVWTPALTSALNNSSDIIRDWRVLAAETDTRGHLRAVAVDWGALARTRRPIIAVIRIDGWLAQLNEVALLAEIRTLAATWHNARVPLAGMEIDYDCGTARLAAYAELLRQLRAVPGLPKRLSITALPAWMESRDFDAVVAAVDEAVLQVHAVRAPKWGLFDPDLARRWIDALDRRAIRPFRVSLPDYGASIVQDDKGDILAVESEMPRLAGGARETDLIAAPREVAHLLRSLEQAPPSHLAGIVWFRLPSEADTRTWSLSTWRAVIRGEALTAKLVAVPRPGAVPGLTDIVLENTSDIDAPLPSSLDLPRDCTLADGVNGYTFSESGKGISLKRLQTGLLYAHHAQVIGWMRCSGAGAEFHVRS